MFTVEVKNALGSVTSQPAKLKVMPDDGKRVIFPFSEGTGTTTTNLGNLSGSAKFALANNYPQFGTKVPAGPFAPPNNSGSVDFGAIGESQSGRAIDFTNPYAGGIGSYPSITICGWLNSRDLRTGPGGNRIAFAAAGVGGPGFDLVHGSDGTLKLGVNQAPDAAPQSSTLITEDPNTGSKSWLMIGLAFLATVINYRDRQALSVIAPALREEFNMSNEAYGYVLSAFMLAYTVSNGLSGPLLDRFGTRLGYAGSMAWWSTAGILHALVIGPWSRAGCRFLLGIGEAGNWPAGVRVVAEWFPARERALAAGIFNSGAAIGAILAPPLVTWLVLTYSWQTSFLVIGLTG